MLEISQLATSFILGLFIGSLLTEALLLVPYWRKMPSKEFLKLHHTLGPQLYRYFAPLTILATIIPIASGIIVLNLSQQWQWLALMPSILAILMLALYFAYFKAANESFKTGSVGEEGVAEELSRWANYHWLRVIMGLCSFAISLVNL